MHELYNQYGMHKVRIVVKMFKFIRLMITNISLYCRCGDRCLNKRFQQRKFAQLFVREVEGKGFGLFTDQGALVNNCCSSYKCLYVCIYIYYIYIAYIINPFLVYSDQVVCIQSVIIFYIHACMYVSIYVVVIYACMYT